MDPIRQQFSVSYSYEVLFTEGLFDTGNRLLRDCLTTNASQQPVRALFVVDEGVVRHHPDLVKQMQEYMQHHEDVLEMAMLPLVVPGGEQVKNDAGYVYRVQEAVAHAAIDRHSFLIAVGGGALLDMAGFAAATAHRGVRHIRIPTTVLSQNDSGVGVKNGINAFNSKNFLGSFAPPVAVINDKNFLPTLDDRDWRGGISEAIKVALIKDASFFDYIEKYADELAPPTRADAPMQHVIYECARMHVEHISRYGDPFETGSSRPLDFGHWAAHKLEALTNYELRHGEAVGIGIALDCVYAHLEGRLDQPSLERILTTFERLGFDLYINAMEGHLDDPKHKKSLFRGLEEFREHLGGQLTVMLLENIGTAIEVHEVDYALYKEAVYYLKDRVKNKAINSNGVIGLQV